MRRAAPRQYRRCRALRQVSGDPHLARYMRGQARVGAGPGGAFSPAGECPQFAVEHEESLVVPVVDLDGAGVAAPGEVVGHGAMPVATAYTVWWKASIAISCGAQKMAGGAMSSAGRVTCALPHMAAPCAAVAARGGRPTASSSPRTMPQPVP